MAPLEGLMARKGTSRGRRKFNLRQVRIFASGTIGALAALDVVSNPVTVTSLNPYRLISVHASYSLSDQGSTIDDGYEFGLAHSDYTAAEVEECLEASASIDIGDKVAQEKSNRLVRSIGIITAGGPITAGGLNFNDGRKVRTKLNWKIGIGQTLNLWVRNGSGVVYTTGAKLLMAGSLWIKDGL